jgi:hypothetical protein
MLNGSDVGYSIPRGTTDAPIEPGWWIKVTGLPLMYWHYILKGHVWFPKHNTAFKGDVA